MFSAAQYPDMVISDLSRSPLTAFIDFCPALSLSWYDVDVSWRLSGLCKCSALKTDRD